MMWMADTKEGAEKAFDSSLDRFGGKYPKAAKCLQKDRKELLAIYNFLTVPRYLEGLPLFSKVILSPSRKA